MTITIIQYMKSISIFPMSFCIDGDKGPISISLTMMRILSIKNSCSLQSPRMHEVSAVDFFASEADVLRSSAADLVKLWNE